MTGSGPVALSACVLAHGSPYFPENKFLEMAGRVGEIYHPAAAPALAPAGFMMSVVREGINPELRRGATSGSLIDI